MGSLKKLVCTAVCYPLEPFENDELIEKAMGLSDAFYLAKDVRKEGGLIAFDLSGIGEIRLAMPGLFNVENAVMAAVLSKELGAADEDVREGIFLAKTPGRMEILRCEEKDLAVIVDFAHNEFAFDNIFGSVKQEYPGYGIYAVFGCPGNKAPERRTGMPRSAAKYADYVYITEDDPFREDPVEICKEVYDNLISFGGKGEIIVNREDAIEEAIKRAPAKSVVLILAKGRDTFMHRREFDPYESDPVIAERILKDLC
jgi:UDP-N-acetylmuramoyl-L-alanyl-D-glutamate--2,6-diaminopimelate ligase